MIVHLRTFARRLRDNASGVALLEFALVLPVVILMSLTGAELTNYITVKMRISQLALQMADDAARAGTGTQLAAKQLSEADINDLFVGANLQSGELNLNANARVVLSSLEPVASPNTTSKYKIRWQRCYGQKTSYAPAFGTAGQTNLTGMGPAGRQVTAQDDNATMFVEIYYVYQPLIGVGTRAPAANFTEIASMSVRDRRDTTDDSATTNLHPNGVYKVSGVTASIC